MIVYISNVNIMNRQIHKSRSDFSNLTNFLIGTFVLLLVFLTGLLQAGEIISLEESGNSSKQVLVVTNRLLIDSDGQSMEFAPELSSDGEHYYLNARATEDQWAFTPKSSLADLMVSETLHEDWLIFIHGDGKTLQSAVQRAYDVQETHQVNVIVYAWPSFMMNWVP